MCVRSNDAIVAASISAGPRDQLNGPRAIAIYAVTTLFALYVVALEGLPSVLVGHFAQALQLDTWRFGLFASAFFWTYLPGQLVTGALLDRFEARWLLAGAAIVAGVTTAALVWTHDFPAAIALRMMSGLASALAVPAALMLAAEWFSPRAFYFAAPAFEGLAFSGGAVCQLFVPSLIAAQGDETALIVTGALGCGLAVLLPALVRRGPRRPRSAVKATNLADVQSVLLSRPIWMVGIAGGLGAALIAGFMASWAPQFLESRWSLSFTDAGRLSALGFVGLACGAPLWGAIGSRTGSPQICMAVGLAIAGVTSGLLIEGPVWSSGIAGVLLFATGLASGAFALVYPLVEASTPSQQRGVSLGFTNLLLMGVGTVVLTPFVGFSLAYFYGSAKRHAPTVIPGGNLLDDHYGVAFSEVVWVYILAPIVGSLVVLWWYQTSGSSERATQ